MGKVVEIDCEKSMKLETSRNVTKSKRSLHWCRSISKNICARFITVSVKKLLHYRAGGLLQYRAVLLHYRAVITVSGVFITLSGSYYSIGRLLHYRLVQPPLDCLSLTHRWQTIRNFSVSFRIIIKHNNYVCLSLSVQMAQC